jgi:hypothetical protein
MCNDGEGPTTAEFFPLGEEEDKAFPSPVTTLSEPILFDGSCVNVKWTGNMRKIAGNKGERLAIGLYLMERRLLLRKLSLRRPSYRSYGRQNDKILYKGREKIRWLVGSS